MGQIINNIDTTGLVMPTSGIELILYLWHQITIAHVFYYGLVIYLVYRFTKWIYKVAKWGRWSE